jgi:hypothetical protein
MKRSLSLEREALADLTNDELAGVQGALPTFEGLHCWLVNPSEARCTNTILDGCIQTR